MTAPDATSHGESSYERTRRDFDSLSLEEQASFLVDATASTLARGIETLGRELAREVERAFKQERASASGTGGRPGPAEPETSQRTSPQ
jgi:hypothetical protein